MPYNAQDKLSKLARPYGVHAIHSENGKLIEHEASAISGGGISVKARLALGESSLHEVERLTYDGVEVDAGNFDFYKESGDAVSADTMFPTRVLNPGASFLDYVLPPGMDVDNAPEKAVARVKCLEIGDFNSSGVQTDFGYSDNAARVAADGIIHLTGDTGLIEWPSFVDYRDWTLENISVTVDEETELVQRFPLNFFLIPPFDLDHFLDRVCQLTCSDWVWNNGKIRFLPAINRTPSFSFNPSNLARVYKFQSTMGEERFNGVRVAWRDVRSPLLTEQDPIVVDRRADENEPENFYELNAGNCRKDVAERLANFWARVKCDLPDYALLRSSFKAYPTLPGDIVEVTHPTPAWTNKRCKILRKLEKEDRETSEGIENFPGYGIFVQVEPENPYSDTDHTPLVTREPVEGVSPFSTPPAPSFFVVEDLLPLNDGTGVMTAFGTVTAGDFGFPQTLKVLWKKPGGVYEDLKDVKPGDDNTATFRATRLKSGTHYFKVFAVSELGVVSTGTEHSLDIDLADFVINGKIIENAADRVFTGIDNNGLYRGRDTAVVPLSVITAQVIKSVVFDNGVSVDLNIAGEVVDAKVLQSSQGDSLFQSKVIVYNKFGELVINLVPDGFTGAGTLGKGTIPRKYADPLEEAIFKITVRNYHGWSLPKYLQRTTLSDSMVSLLTRANVVQDLTGSPTSSSSIRFSGTFTFGANTLKLQRRNVGQTISDWTDHATGITALPYDAVGLPENSPMEFRMVSSANAAYISNIARATTYAQPQSAPDYPAPISLAGSQDATTPTTKLNFSAISKGNVDTKLFVDGVEDGSSPLAPVAVDGTISFSLTGLTADTDYLVKIQHDYGSGHLSDFTTEITVRTAATPPSETPPTITGASYDPATQQVSVPFAPGSGGSGNYTVAESATEGGTYTNLTTSLAASPFTETIAQTGSIQNRWYKVKRSAGFSEPVQVSIPAVDMAHSPINLVASGPGDDDSFDLSWVNRGGAGYNKIWRKKGTGGTWFVISASVPATDTDFHANAGDFPILGNGDHFFRIENLAIPGVFAYSDAVFLHI